MASVRFSEVIIRGISIVLSTFILYILQSGPFTSISLAGVVPDLIIILIIAVAFQRGRTPAMLTGMLGGFLIDCCYNSILGLNALIYLVIGYISGFTHKIYDEDDHMTPLLMVSISEFLYNIMYYFFFFLLKGKINFGFYLFRIIMPRIVYTVLICIVLYPVINAANRYLMRFDNGE